MTSRDKQKEQRRQVILMTALELFVKKGYSETKITDIAQAAGMSTGLLFHYFESKECLYAELVKLGVEGTSAPQTLAGDTFDPLSFFTGFLTALFEYSRKQPWVFNMFVLIAQARRSNATPPEIRKLAMTVDQIGQSAQIIRLGQANGVFRDGDPLALSSAFWCSVQGIMEQVAAEPDTPLPDPEWLIDIIRRK